MRNVKNWISVIVLSVLFVIESVITYFGFVNDWGLEIKIGLIFMSVLTLFNNLLTILNKFDNKYDELRDADANEHREIKGAIELYKNIERLDYIVNFEHNYIDTQNIGDVEMWIISNSIAEPPEIIKKIFDNLCKGIKYYYVIPNGAIWTTDIRNIAEQLNSLDKKSVLNKNNFLYIQDDLFDLMPTDIVDILFYCNPQSTDYRTNMKVFYAFHDNDMDDVYYKPADLNEVEIRHYFEKLAIWRERQWNKVL